MLKVETCNTFTISDTIILQLSKTCRAFPVAAALTWNSLPEHIVSAFTLQSFKRHLKTFLLQQSFRLAL